MHKTGFGWLPKNLRQFAGIARYVVFVGNVGCHFQLGDCDHHLLPDALNFGFQLGFRMDKTRVQLVDFDIDICRHLLPFKIVWE
jgi:hypothetical protein